MFNSQLALEPVTASTILRWNWLKKEFSSVRWLLCAQLLLSSNFHTFVCTKLQAWNKNQCKREATARTMSPGCLTEIYTSIYVFIFRQKATSTNVWDSVVQDDSNTKREAQCLEQIGTQNAFCWIRAQTGGNAQNFADSGVSPCTTRASDISKSTIAWGAPPLLCREIYNLQIRNDSLANADPWSCPLGHSGCLPFLVLRRYQEETAPFWELCCVVERALLLLWPTPLFSDSLTSGGSACCLGFRCGIWRLGSYGPFTAWKPQLPKTRVSLYVSWLCVPETCSKNSKKDRAGVHCLCPRPEARSKHQTFCPRQHCTFQVTGDASCFLRKGTNTPNCFWNKKELFWTTLVHFHISDVLQATYE